MDAGEFLDSRYGDGQGKAVVALNKEDKGPVLRHWFDWPAQREQMLAATEARNTDF